MIFCIFFSYFVSHSWGIPMMKITGLSHLFKWENLHNWWLTKYFFAPLYIYIYIYMHIHDSRLYWWKYRANPLLGCFSTLIWFYTPLPRVNFNIVNEEGQICEYILQLGFGSSYTVLIPSTFNFGESVSHVFTVPDYSMNTIKNS